MQKFLTVALRLGLGWIFLWPFLDKTFGLGFSTAPESSWLNGNSPTLGFLKNATQGPFGELFAGLAGNPAVDWLFMGGLLLVGLSLILGIGLRIASAAGALMLILIWLATLFPAHNPFLDEHLIYSATLLLLPALNAGDHWGLGRWWKSQKWVKKNPWIQ